MWHCDSCPGFDLCPECHNLRPDKIYIKNHTRDHTYSYNPGNFENKDRVFKFYEFSGRTFLALSDGCLFGVRRASRMVALFEIDEDSIQRKQVISCVDARLTEADP